MTQTNPLSRLKYGDLKVALICAEGGKESAMNNALESVEYYCLQLGVPLAQSVKEYIQNIYMAACNAEKIREKADCRELIKPRRIGHSR